jgi:hypothetical protein
MKNRCPQYEAGAVGAAAHRGTAMHDALAKMMGAEPTLDLFELEEGDSKEVEWAYDKIRSMTTETWPTEVELKLSYHDSKYKEIYFGHGDVVNGPNLFDLKTGEQHSYWHQMAAYALALMDEKGYGVVNVHLVFSRYQKVQSFAITREQAEPAILDIITRCSDPNAPTNPNEFCGWCKKNIVCPAVKERVNAIVSYNDWKLDSYNPAEILKDPKELSKAIFLSRMMKKWVDAIEKASKKHDQIPGFQWKEVKGRKSIKDLPDLFLDLGNKLSHIQLDDFLSKCSLSIGALEAYISNAMGVSKKDAKKYIETHFNKHIKTAESYKKLEEKK